MHEYCLTPWQYFHLLTPKQIELLEKSIMRRKMIEERDSLYAYHYSPEKRIKYLDQAIKGLEPTEYKDLYRPFTEDEINTFKIHIEAPKEP